MSDPSLSFTVDGVTTEAVAFEVTRQGKNGSLRLSLPVQRYTLVGGSHYEIPTSPVAYDLDALPHDDADVVALKSALQAVSIRLLNGDLAP